MFIKLWFSLNFFGVLVTFIWKRRVWQDRGKTCSKRPQVRSRTCETFWPPYLAFPLNQLSCLAPLCCFFFFLSFFPAPSQSFNSYFWMRQQTDGGFRLCSWAHSVISITEQCLFLMRCVSEGQRSQPYSSRFQPCSSCVEISQDILF